MVGFIKRLFGSKPKAEKTEEGKAQSVAPKPKKRGSQAFYLSSDEAKTFGNIEFMRSTTTIKRSFPKTLAGEATEVTEQVSSMEKATSANKEKPKAEAEMPSASTEAQSERRRADSSMDMFRNMARDINKKS
jgi:hypothetical protein